MDEQIRRLERQAAAGDHRVRQQWRRALLRAGYPDPDEVDLIAPFTEWEEAQKDYDDTFWHADRRYRLQLWGGSENGFGMYGGSDVDPVPVLYKAHHTWGHLGWDNKNSKQKTLRTHRNGKHKSRKFRLRTEDHVEGNGKELPHERRRRKRFGGRERLYGCEWVWNPHTERYGVVYWVRIPDLDE